MFLAVEHCCWHKPSINQLTKIEYLKVFCSCPSFQSEECLSQEEVCLRHCRARLDHIKEHADERKSAVVLWKKKRLDRMLVDHCLRSGFYETAIKLARDSQIEVGFLHVGWFSEKAPSKTEERANLTLYFYKAAGLTQA